MSYMLKFQLKDSHKNIAIPLSQVEAIVGDEKVGAVLCAGEEYGAKENYFVLTERYNTACEELEEQEPRHD